MFNILALAVTNRCPLNCSFCAVPPGPGDLSDYDVERLAIEAYESGQFKEIGFTGGEPLLRKDIILKVGMMLTKRGMPWGLTTGLGWAKTKEQAIEVVNQLSSAGIHHITVSVDESHLMNKSPEISEAFIAEAISLKTKVIVSVTRYKEDYNENLPINIDTDSEYISVDYHYVSNAGKAEANCSDLQSRFDIKNSKCLLKDGISLSVWPDGSVYPCCSPFVVNKYSDLAIGNILDNQPLQNCINKLSENLYLKAIINYGFSGLMTMTPEFKGWGDIFKGDVNSVCHLCAKISAKKGSIDRLNRMILEKADH